LKDAKLLFKYHDTKNLVFLTFTLTTEIFAKRSIAFIFMIFHRRMLRENTHYEIKTNGRNRSKRIYKLVHSLFRSTNKLRLMILSRKRCRREKNSTSH